LTTHRRLSELQIEIARDCNKYTRHALRPSSPSVPSTPVSSASPTQSPTIPSSRNGNHATPNIPSKDLALLARIDTNYTEVDRLAEEKILLAERIVGLLARARSRLDVELSRVNMLQGDLVPDNIYGYGGSFGQAFCFSPLTVHF
jgi:chromatin modification-related protein YNG2